MDTRCAIAVSHEVAELTALVTCFQAKFGKHYRITPESPVLAHELRAAIFERQGRIARLLDVEERQAPAKRWLEWWRWQDVMDTSITGELALEAHHLIACCAFYEADPHGPSSPAIHSSQMAIAGMLHPDTCCTGLHQPLASPASAEKR